MKMNFLSMLLLAGALAACSGSDTTEPPVEPVIPPGPDPTPEQTYQVGDLYDRDGVQGVVYLLTDDRGTHGMMVSLTESERPWSVETVETGANLLDNGKYNCTLIRNRETWGAKYPAFKWCNDFNAGRYGGWYIPSLYEMNDLYIAFNGGGGISNETSGISPCAVDAEAQARFNKYLTDAGGTPLSQADYWTSSEYGAGFAYPYDFVWGGMDGYGGSKANIYKVRAVRGF